MEKVKEDTYRMVSDPMMMPAEMRKVAEELKAEGYDVKHGAAGIIIIELEDGEVHFSPADGRIIRRVMRKN